MKLTPLAALPLLIGLSCDGGDAVDSSDTDADTDTDADADTDYETGETGDPSLTASLNGTVLDPDGGPQEGFRVNVCRSLCRTVQTQTDGSYDHPALPVETASFYVQGDPTVGYATPYAPLTWLDNEEKTVDIRLLVQEPSLPVGRGSEYDFGNGLMLSFEDGDVVEVLSRDPIEEVAATAAPDDARPPIEIDGEIPRSVYYLAPFEAEGPAKVSLQNTWGFVPGNEVNVYYAENPVDSGWTYAGTLTVGDGEWLLGEAEIEVFTVLAVTTTDVVDE